LASPRCKILLRGVGTICPPGKHRSANFQKSSKIECKHFCEMFGFGYFINRGGLLTEGGGYRLGVGKRRDLTLFLVGPPPPQTLPISQPKPPLSQPSLGNHGSGTWHDLVPGTIWYLARPGRSGTWHDLADLVSGIWYLVSIYIYIYIHIYIHIYISIYIYIHIHIQGSHLLNNTK
jgi:hypothetical protein